MVLIVISAIAGGSDKKKSDATSTKTTTKSAKDTGRMSSGGFDQYTSSWAELLHENEAAENKHEYYLSSIDTIMPNAPSSNSPSDKR